MAIGGETLVKIRSNSIARLLIAQAQAESMTMVSAGIFAMFDVD
jgi:hypothetical protein